MDDQPFARLMLATERTEFDEGAERLALALAGHCGVRLMVVVPLVTNAEYEALAPELAARADRDIADRLAQLHAAAAAAGIALELRVRRGDEPAREIVADAEERRADLLIVRRRGRRGFLAQLLVGDMVSRVAACTRASLLMVPRAGRMWHHRVLAAVDASPAAARVAAVAAAAARRCALPLRLVSVAGSDALAARDEATAALARASRAAGGACDSALRIGKPAEEILADAAASESDLIVVGAGPATPDRPQLGATAQKVIGLGTGPVLVVR